MFFLALSEGDDPDAVARMVPSQGTAEILQIPYSAFFELDNSITGLEARSFGRTPGASRPRHADNSL